MSFFPLKKSDVISTTFRAFPSYELEIGGSGVGTEFIYVFNSSSEGVSRTFSDLNGNPITGSFLLSGAMVFGTNSIMSGNRKAVLNRLRNVYASSSFVKTENYTSSSLFNEALDPTQQTFSYIDIPQIAYGAEIRPGSFNFETITFVGARTNFYTDDSYGGIFSGSEHVGCIFYQHGVVLLGSKFEAAISALTASFSGTHDIPTNLYLCRVPRGELNFSNNQSYVSLLTGSNTQEISTKQPKTFITGVGLYDKDFKLLGVAKISSPILNEEETAILFKLKLAF